VEGGYLINFDLSKYCITVDVSICNLNPTVLKLNKSAVGAGILNPHYKKASIFSSILAGYFSSSVSKSM